MNTMKLDSYKAKIEYDSDLDMFRGEVLGINGGADFYGQNPSELRKGFRNSLNIFLEVCAEKGISPTKEYPGKLNLRIDPKLHSNISIQALAEEKSLNQWIIDTLENSLHNPA
ncbi:MAG: type II toxin-antitoxin system HicB family antitoxin [Candidatus Cloacimonetes bacterium]|nr:type II toxin-antitoxin system HicB family antitoxin [Candidatus Cloacimonadota bacterium]